jgi:hypothetical protein
MGCSRPTSSMLAAKELISPRFFLKRIPNPNFVDR